MSADLIERIRERPTDQHRWAAWYRSVYPKLYYVAFRLTNGDVAAARDLVQETFARFVTYRAIERVSNDRHALSFLSKTCRNLAFDGNARARQLPQESPEELESIAGAEQPMEPALDFDRMIRALEPQDRQLMQWAYEGLTISEIAAKLGVTYSAAGVRLHRVRKRLRESYG
jgi:RNA polymerase sigma-70 factor (ECF subfamily)